MQMQMPRLEKSFRAADSLYARAVPIGSEVRLDVSNGIPPRRSICCRRVVRILHSKNRDGDSEPSHCF